MNPLANKFNLSRLVARLKSPALVLGTIILTALIAFEVFNYSTTEYALRDVLGDLRFAGITWATILSIAFCGIDFAGIARLFTPEQGVEEPKAVWYLFGAWLLAATMNAILTWWGVSMAISQHAVRNTAVVDAKTMSTIVPVFVALMVWVIRILIIGTLSVAGDRMLWGERRPANSVTRQLARPAAPAPIAASSHQASRPVSTPRPLVPTHSPVNARPAMNASPAASRPTMNAAPLTAQTNTPAHSEPTYHSLTM
jgi:hypothetical protein